MTLPLTLLALLLGGGQARPVQVPPAKAAAPATVTAGPDTELARLRARYVGKEVWVYGDAPLHCYTKNRVVDISGPFTEPVRVVGLQRWSGTVSRTRRVLPELPIKNALLLRVRPPDSFKEGSWGMAGDSASLRPLEGTGCREFLLPFVNGADMLQFFSLTPPDAAMRKALAPFHKPDNSASIIGLSHQQVLWLRGVPDEPRGNLPTILQAPAWMWYGPPGYGDFVFHFQNDRVVKVEAPSAMP